MAAYPSSEESFMFETWQIIAIIVLVVAIVGFFIWKKKSGG
jgi:hypothetical protein